MELSPYGPGTLVAVRLGPHSQRDQAAFSMCSAHWTLAISEPPPPAFSYTVTWFVNLPHSWQKSWCCFVPMERWYAGERSAGQNEWRNVEVHMRAGAAGGSREPHMPHG